MYAIYIYMYSEINTNNIYMNVFYSILQIHPMETQCSRDLESFWDQSKNDVNSELRPKLISSIRLSLSHRGTEGEAACEYFLSSSLNWRVHPDDSRTRFSSCIKTCWQFGDDLLRLLHPTATTYWIFEPEANTDMSFKNVIYKQLTRLSLQAVLLEFWDS